MNVFVEASLDVCIRFSWEVSRILLGNRVGMF